MGIKGIASRAFFDKRDHTLLRIVNQALEEKSAASAVQQSFYPHFHPRGIKELAESRGLRVAYAMAHLLNSLEVGKMDERLGSLRSLFHEVLSIGMGPLPKNTARVLLQIMKELVRARGDYERQLRLAHDFRVVAFGKPRVVRQHLRDRHLLEMPESWNQLAFDDHVHDAYTKGRKSSTHLIMDAWIKGIRRLRVVYYNFVEPKVAAELLEAARIVGMDVRIGVEFSALFRDRYVNLIWTPRGFADSQAFLCFLAEDNVARFMQEGRKVSAYQQQFVLRALERFNEYHRLEINRELGICLAPLDKLSFMRFVGEGQMSLLHLGAFIHKSLLVLMQEKLAQLKQIHGQADEKEKQEIARMVEVGNGLTKSAIVERFLDPAANPDIPNPNRPQPGEGVPELLKLTPRDIIGQLTSLHTGHRITLNLCGLAEEDVLEILYQCEGAITRLEILNLKEWMGGKSGPIARISSLQQAINDGNIITLKRQVSGIIEKIRLAEPADKQDRLEKLEEILHDLLSLKAWYAITPLKSRMGSDSTGRQSEVYGMGLAVLETLPRQVQRQVRRENGAGRMILPMHITPLRQHTYYPKTNSLFCSSRVRPLISFWGLDRFLCHERIADWQIDDKFIGMAEEGNIVTLGGVAAEQGNGLTLEPEKAPPSEAGMSFRYLNTPLKYVLKVLIGFIPAFFTFVHTQDWWLLAYFGAVIWFFATGIRNIIQSVLGGGGIKRSPLMKWNNFVSWERLTDSLMWTGFSVPLLELVVKTWLCRDLLGITTATSPVALYAILALVNGVYISGHNALRGLPRGAIVGNLFRTALSIPIAFAFNALAGAALSSHGVANVNEILQKWAAIISKAASDCVAALIEGTADRHQNLVLRRNDYSEKFRQLMNLYSQLEVLYPNAPTDKLLVEPERFERGRTEAQDLEKLLFVNALDMLYFWMYQPRARIAYGLFVESLSGDERRLLEYAQKVLEKKKEISRLFIDGMVGENFSRALSFYLEQSPQYLKDIKELSLYMQMKGTKA
jgi:hypothetical protein